MKYQYHIAKFLIINARQSLYFWSDREMGFCVFVLSNKPFSFSYHSANVQEREGGGADRKGG